MADYTYNVTVASSVFVLDGESQAEIALGHDLTYRFDLSHSSNSGHTFRFSATSDGERASGTQYSTGYTTSGTPGSADAYVELAVTSGTTATLYYYCSNHDAMGGKVVSTSATFVETPNLGAKIPVAGDAEDVWAAHLNAGIRKMDSQLQPLAVGDDVEFATIKLTGGSPGVDKVLTSDADGDATWVAPVVYDDNQIQTNIALLGFKIAVNGSLAKYDLQDQIIDEYETEDGIDTDASINQIYASEVSYSGTKTQVTVTTTGSPSTGEHTSDGVAYTWYKWIATTDDWSYETDTAQDHDYLVVGGGGGSGSSAHGGAGAGAFRTATDFPVAADTPITVTVGIGGDASASGPGGKGSPSVFSSIEAEGGGLGPSGGGGSGGGGSQGATGGTATNASYGNDGGTGSHAPPYPSGGGGGAGAEGGDNISTASGVGGAGENNVMGMSVDADSDAFLTAVDAGVDAVDGFRYFAGGGGGGAHSSGSTLGAGGIGGGGAGGTVAATDGTPNTGGGGGGGGTGSGGVGGSGIVIIRRLTTVPIVYSNLTLQSTDTIAEAAPTKADMVILVEDAGLEVGAVNTHIKGWVSRDSGFHATNSWTEVLLVDEGHWEGGPTGGKRILAAHDVSLTDKNSGTAMCYKITTHSASADYDTRIHATSLGWR